MYSLACITGATSGIGEALAHLLASKKIPLLLSGRNEKKLEELKEILSPQTNVLTVAADLALPEGQKIMMQAIKQYTPTLLINNAGIGLYGPFLKQSQEKIEELLVVNNQALVALTHTCLQVLLEKGEKGIIMNVSSAAAFQVFPYFSLYAASKTFVNHFSLSLDQEVKHLGIRVLACCPGVVKTNFRVRAEGQEGGSPEALMMTVEFAAREILYQIERKIPLRIFDFRYRLLTFISRWIPATLKAKLFKKSLSKINN